MYHPIAPMEPTAHAASARWSGAVEAATHMAIASAVCRYSVMVESVADRNWTIANEWMISAPNHHRRPPHHQRRVEAPSKRIVEVSATR